MSILSLHNVSRHFGGQAAVKDVTLEVEQGEFVTLLGPSGCGKTTTLRMVAGLEQNTGGTIVIAGETVSDAGCGLFVAPERRNIGMVFQSYAIWPHMTVFENVAYPAELRRESREQRAQRVHRALSLVAMEAYADRPAPALSGGQQQRVAIARALVAEPRLLLMDEPLSNLDAKLRDQMRTELKALQGRLGMTTLYVTHDQEEAMALSDRIVVMANGAVLQVDAPTEIYRHPRSRQVADFFGTPNFLDGTARAVSGRLAVVDGRGWSCRAAFAGAVQAGQRVHVLVRPEGFTSDPVDEGGLSLAGRIVRATYKGARYQAVFATGDTELQVELPQDHARAIGDPVTLSVPSSRLWVLPLDG